MDFSEKIKKIRKENNLTQEQLAEILFVSRTAISKWESGRGYPSLDLLKYISKTFKISVDELLSSNEIIDIAEDEKRTDINKINNLIFGLLDLMSVLFIFLPLYSKKTNDFVYSVSLFSENDISNTMKCFYFTLFLIMFVIGILEIICNFTVNKKVARITNVFSFIIQAISIIFFALTRQPYIIVLMFMIMIIKGVVIVKDNFKKQYNS